MTAPCSGPFHTPSMPIITTDGFSMSTDPRTVATTCRSFSCGTGAARTSARCPGRPGEGGRQPGLSVSRAGLAIGRCHQGEAGSPGITVVHAEQVGTVGRPRGEDCTRRLVSRSQRRCRCRTSSRSRRWLAPSRPRRHRRFLRRVTHHRLPTGRREGQRHGGPMCSHPRDTRLRRARPTVEGYTPGPPGVGMEFGPQGGGH